MLIIQIALGIVLGFLILNNLSKISALFALIFLIVLLGAIIIGVLTLIIIFFKEILFILAIPLIFLCGYISGLGIYLLIAKHYKKIKKTKTTKEAWITIFAILNFLSMAFIYDSLPFSSNIHKWSFSHGFEDAGDIFVICLLSLWSLVFILTDNNKRKSIQLTKAKIIKHLSSLVSRVKL